MSEKELGYDITANPTAFVEAMQKVASTSQGAADDVERSFKKVQEVFGSVQKVVMGLTAVIAGGAMFKNVIASANDWNSGAGKLAKTLGITTEQASVLNVALDHLGIDSDTYTGASLKMSKQIFSNADAFKVLGVAVRDTTTGAYRPVTEVMSEVNQKLAAIKNPIEQNIAGMQVYGKSWGELKSIIKLTQTQLDEAEKQARSLGLIVGPEGVAATKQYKEQMRDLGLVSKSLEIQFGNALLPIFKQTGKFLGEEGPAMGKVFASILETIAITAETLWIGLKDVGGAIGALAAQAASLLHGDIAGMKAIGKARDEEHEKNVAAVVDLMEAYGKPLPALKSAPDQDPSDPVHNFKDKNAQGGDKSRMSEWEAKLATDKAALTRQGLQEDQFREMSKGKELQYWNDLKAKRDLTDGEKIALARKAAEIESSMVKDTFDQKVRVLESEAAQYKNNTEKRIELERAIQAKYAEGTKGYEEAQKRINEIQRQAGEQAKQLAMQQDDAHKALQLADIQRAEQLAQLEFDLGNTSKAQLLQQQQQFEDQRYAIAREALNKRLNLATQTGGNNPDVNQVEVAKIHADLEAAEAQHENRMAAIRNQGKVLAIQNSQQVYSAITNDMQGNLAKMMQGQQNFNGFMHSLWGSLQSAVANVLAKMLITEIENTTAMAAVKRAFAIFDIEANAAQTGAASAASAAETPVSGWMIAAGAAAAGFAMASAFKGGVPTFSAAGGFDISGTLNPITQLHAREMVLPAKHADVIRSLADQGQGASSGGGDVHLHVHATDSESVARLFRDNGHHIVTALRQQHRNFNTYK